MKKYLYLASLILVGILGFMPSSAVLADSCEATEAPVAKVPTESAFVYMYTEPKEPLDTDCSCQMSFTATSCSDPGTLWGAPVNTWTTSCSVPCEASIGAGLAYVQGAYLQSEFYMPTATSSGDPYYQCPGTTRATDEDRDFIPADADEDDFDSRVGTVNNFNDGCDGVDNDNDGCIDEGRSYLPTSAGSCSVHQSDYKRLWANGHAAPEGQVNLREGWLLRSEVDAMIEGPYGQLTFARYFNSDVTQQFYSSYANFDQLNPFGTRWSHSFNIWIARDELELFVPVNNPYPEPDLASYVVHMGNGTEHYFYCNEDLSEWTEENPSGGIYDCSHIERAGGDKQYEIMNTHLRRRYISGVGKVWQFFPGDGTVYNFKPDGNDDDINFAQVAEYRDMTTDGLIWKAEYDQSEQLEYIRTADTDTYYRFEYGTNNKLEDLYANVGGRGEVLLAQYYDEPNFQTIASVALTTSTQWSLQQSLDVMRTYEYESGTGNLLTVKDHIDANTEIVTSRYTWWSSGKVRNVRGANMWTEFTYSNDKTTVSYLDSSAGNKTVNFFHGGGRYVYKRDKDYHQTSIPRYIERDNFGRPSCVMSDDGVMTKYFYSITGANSLTPERHTVIADYGTTGSCENEPSQNPLEPSLIHTNGTLQRVSWVGEMFDVRSQSWRPWYESEMSPISSYTPSTCQTTAATGGHGLPNGCYGTFYEYADSDSQHQAKGALAKIKQFFYGKEADGTLFVDSVDTYLHRGDICTFQDPDYNFPWQVCSIADADVSGNVINKTVYDYDSDGLLEATKIHYSASDVYETSITNRDLLGRPSQVESPSGVTLYRTYDLLGTVKQETVSRAFRDQSGNPTSYSSSVITNNMNLPVEIVSPLGNKQQLTFNTGSSGFGRVHGILEASPTGQILSAVRNDYTDAGHIDETNTIDVANEPSCYDEDCSISAMRNVVNRDALGRPLTTHQFTSDVAYPSDAISINVYNPITGQLESMTDFVGNETEYEYDEQGRLQEIHSDINGLSATQNQEYDDLNRPEKTTSPTGVETEKEYDDRGLLIKDSSESHGDAYYEYDLRGHIVRSIHVRYGSQNPTIDPNRDEVCYEYDWLGRLQTVDENCDSNPDWTYVYDEAFEWCNGGDTQTNKGKLTSLYSDDWGGMHRKWCYYAGGKVEKEFTSPTNEFWDDPEDSDKGGFVLARGTHYIYDQTGRLTSKKLGTYPHGDNIGALEVAYDYDSERVHNVKQVKVRYYGYFGWDSVWKEITSSSTYPKYSVYGLEEVTLANGLVVDYTHDKAGRITNTFIDDGSNTALDLDVSYDANSNVLSALDSGHMGIDRHFEYDGLNRLTCESETGIGCPQYIASPLGADVRVAYNYDLSNNRTRLRTKLGGTTHEDYTIESFSDRIDYYEYDNVQQFIDYDDQGRINALAYPVPDSDHLYRWNVHGQMEKACADGDYFTNDLNDCTSRFYEYAGPGGQLFARYDDSIAGNGTQTGDRQFYWSGNQIDLVREFEDDDEKLGYYIWMNGVPIAKVDANMVHVSGNGALPESYSNQHQSITWIHTDYVGAPVVATDENASVVWEWDRTPYGRNIPSGDIEIDVRFPGQIYDEYADANYNQNRWYSPWLGQYLSPDPIGIAGGINYYGYAEGNPTSYIDPNGLEGKWVKGDPNCTFTYGFDEDGVESGHLSCPRSVPEDVEFHIAYWEFYDPKAAFTPKNPSPSDILSSISWMNTVPNLVIGAIPNFTPIGSDQKKCHVSDIGRGACDEVCTKMFKKSYVGRKMFTESYCPAQWFTRQPDGNFNQPSMQLTGCSHYYTEPMGGFIGIGFCDYLVNPRLRHGESGPPKVCTIMARTAPGGKRPRNTHITSAQDAWISRPLMFNCR